MMDRDLEEGDHGGEMQYPYLVKVLKNASEKKGSTSIVPILPIMVGDISFSLESEYGSLLTEIIAREDVFSILSTDFCHWGERFSYQPRPSTTTTATTKVPEIFEFIQDLDQQGMRCIEKKDPGAFDNYLEKTSNTICGRHAIQTWLNAVVHSEKALKDNASNTDWGELKIEFNKYAQSSNVRSMSESSVSYGSAIARVSRQS